MDLEQKYHTLVDLIEEEGKIARAYFDNNRNTIETQMNKKQTVQ